GHGDPVLERQARTWADLDFVAFRDRHGKAAGHGMARTGYDGHILCGDDVHSGCADGRIGRKGQIGAMRQAPDADRDFSHGRAHCASASAIFSTSLFATSALGIVSQVSTCFSRTMCTVLLVPPVGSAPSGPDASVATIQSTPLLLRFLRAFSTTFAVSAAKPVSSGGRFSFAARLANMSGFSVSSRAGGAEPRFL